MPDDDDDDCCPICLGGETDETDRVESEESTQERGQLPPPMVHGKCGHSCCLPCFRRIFTQPHNVLPLSNAAEVLRHPTPEDFLNVPTKGRCPVCRAILDVFELQYAAAAVTDEDRDGNDYGKPRYVYPVQQNELSELAGMVFVRRRRKEDDFSLHFPEAGSTDDSPFLALPQLQTDPLVWDDGTLVGTGRVPFKNCRYHTDSKTFYGSIVWGADDNSKRFRGDKRWDYVFSFSSDFRYVSRGLLIKRPNDSEDEPPSAILKAGSDQSVEDGTRLTYFRLGVVLETEVMIAPYNSEFPWGNVFCQALTVGMASYHFLEDGSGAYISYEHERTSVWPHLDNGRPIPSRISFSETSYDPDSARKVFRGKIDWEGTHRTTWNGSRWWRYEIVFADDFSCIIGGAVYTQQNHTDSESCMSRFGEDLIYLNCGLLEDLKSNESTLNSRGVAYSNLTNRLQSIRRQMEAINAPTESTDRLQAMFLLAYTRDINYPATRTMQAENNI